MRQYDPVVAGNDAFLVLRDKQIVAHWGHQGLTSAQHTRRPRTIRQYFIFLDDDPEPRSLWAADPWDAIELLRREFVPELVDEFVTGEQMLYRCVYLPAPLPEDDTEER